MSRPLAAVTTRRSLTELYTELNLQFWEGRLPYPRVSAPALYKSPARDRGVAVRRVPVKLYGRGLRSQGQADAIGLFRPAGEFSAARINILSPLDDEQERRVLIHEMIHCWLRFERPDVQEAHGPEFVLELERLAGLGEEWATEQAAHYREIREPSSPAAGGNT